MVLKVLFFSLIYYRKLAPHSHSFIPQILLENLLCARQHSRCRGYKSKQDRDPAFSYKGIFLFQGGQKARYGRAGRRIPAKTPINFQFPHEANGHDNCLAFFTENLCIFLPRPGKEKNLSPGIS